MSPGGARTFVGFGFGPIQAGLFLFEAWASGAFGRLAVAYRRPEVIAAVRAAGGIVRVNVAHDDRIETVAVGPIELYDVGVAEDREAVVAAIAEASELATALASVGDYASEAPGSVHRLLAAGMGRKLGRGGPRAVVYAAENHNRAAELLAAAVLEELPPDRRRRVAATVGFLDTIITKMSVTVRDPLRIAEQGLAPVAPGLAAAFLVEAYDRFLVAAPVFDTPFRRSLAAFEEKADLRPFEEAKLYGHNAAHALLAYLGQVLGVRAMRDLADSPGVLPFVRAAYLQEAGRALVRRHGGLDPLFTPEGFRAYGERLLGRMLLPSLRDTTERVGRDAVRKLAWSDRLAGTLRLVREEGIRPGRLAFGTAAAVVAAGHEADAEAFLRALWAGSGPAPGEQAAILGLVAEGLAGVRRWRAAGFPDLEGFYAASGNA